MDTTEKYRAMCEKAKELQNKHTLKIGDYVVRFWRSHEAGGRIGNSAGNGIVDWVSGDSHTIIGDEWSHYRDEAIWLPYQDQLQEAMKESHTMGAMIQDLYWFYEPEHFCPDRDNDYIECKCEEIGTARRKMFTSIEQFWLAVVMDELYKKEWSGSEWILKKDAQASIANP